MAADYWSSTQRRYWHFSRDGLSAIRQKLEDEDRQLVQQYPLPDRRLLSLFFNHQLAKLCKRMPIRQQALATAQVYLRRFYCKVEIRKTNPYLVIATALYLACKMEECPQPIRAFVSESCQLWPGFFVASEIAKLGECEFYLISEMNSQMIVHHPYRTLQQLQSTLDLGQDDFSLAWSVINDHYFTDLPLLHPPHVIAVTAIFLSTSLKRGPTGTQSAAGITAMLSDANSTPRDASTAKSPAGSVQQKKMDNFVNWLAESEVDIKAIMECSQEIISLYDILEQYSDQACKEQIARFVRARGLDK